METRIKQKLTELGADLSEKLGVAVSGGIDSMVLLDCLLRLDIPVRVYHMEHGIRGKQSTDDMDFVKAHCERLGIECVVKTVRVPETAQELGLSIETAARRLRYEFLDSAPERFIVSAHHMDDLAETVIMNLVRGSGLGGLCGIPEKRGRYLRPMLGISRKEIEEYAKANGVRYVEDATNNDISYTRNYIRKQILPRLGEINEAVVQNIARTANLLGEDERALEDIAENAGCVQFSKDEAAVDIEKLGQQCKAVRKRIIRLAISGVSELVDVENVHIDSILELAEKGISAKTVNLKYGLTASVVYGKLIIGKNAVKRYNYSLTALPREGRLRIGNMELEICGMEPDEEPRFAGGVEYFDADTVQESVLRQRMEGDYIVPLGMSGKKRLSDYLSDRKVPLSKRDGLIVLAKGSEVFWVVGVGVSEDSKVGQNSRIIKIKYQEKQL